ncbi:MAG: hypothetical protein KME18_07030 [Phormidium tanganyikae FI6-MK23]|jgi:hypothetical protein|nr:hypothetical protein [Phormidium tanganyikae FI6-MK23]
MMQSLLPSNVERNIVTDPFPYFSTQSAIAPEVCAQLISEFPSLETVTQGLPTASNERFSYPARLALFNESLSPLWREFVEYHVSQAFLDQFVQLFQNQIRACYPNFEADFGRLDQLRAGVRGLDDFSNADVLLDAQICVNTPVVGVPCSVRRGHVDATNKLLFGLFYLRPETDSTSGGDLEIYRLKNKEQVYRGGFVDDRYLKVVQTIPYQANHCVIGINSIRSLHGVTVRNVTPQPRLFFNLVGEVNRPLFDTSLYALSPTWVDRTIEQSAKAVKKLARVVRSRAA